MLIAVWAPLLLPFLAAPLARRLAEALSPRTAAWTLAGSAAVLACGTLCSLGLLAAAGLLQLPPVAALGHLSLPWLTAAAPDAPFAAAAAALTLAVVTVLAARTARRRRLELRTARAALPPGDQHPDMRPPRASVRRSRLPERWTGRLRSALAPLRLPLRLPEPPLTVLDDERADAFALPGRLRRPGRPAEPGRIVVTAGMLRALSGSERSALLAHERAHLAARHHVFLALAEHAAGVHPALRALRTPLGYHLERWADEVAAARVGDRAVTARAVGRAALAASRSPRPDRPRLAPAAHSGPVPRRVAALLQPRPAVTPGTRLRAVALALAVCLALSTAATLEATADLHRTVEAAQQGDAAQH
ncbi:M56 family metallopeptidase [Streptomyces sp. NRRL S-350]|uniref:M56 family metallopeptidase n=1 Tax=Streptomyces sp. NRRL S-350 TaxID=1463902 RepID=UPI0004C16E64|nr:M56 family metallopeptidase [Streptomyces sp. NRRL S-350]